MPKSVKDRQAALMDEARTTLRSTDTMFVDYDFEPNNDGSEITLRRTVWFKAVRTKDRDVLHQEDVAVFLRDQVPDAVRSFVMCVTV